MANKKQYVVDNSNLMTKWDYEKNSEIGLFPESITSCSGRKAWWKCNRGHSWTASIYRITSGQGCPYCSNRKVLFGYNDLATVNPELVNEWDYVKNTQITPTNVTSGSHKKVWWLCKRGHSWIAEIKSRVNGSGCPYCSGRRAIPNTNDLVTLFPQVSLEWNYQKNKDLDPHLCSAYSNKKVWWICKNGHEWEAQICSRTNKGRNCPYCANQKVLKGYNDLQSLYPELASEWNYSKNNGVFPHQVIAHTGKKYWWICERGHEWEASVNSRIGGRGCRLCSQELGTSFPEQALYYYLKHVFPEVINGYSNSTISEIDIFIPSMNTGIEYDGQYYHTNIDRDRKKDEMISSNGIRLIRIKENSIIDYKTKPFLEKGSIIFYNPQYKDRLNAVILRVFEVLGIKTLPEIDIERDRINIWSQYIERAKNNSLQALFPDIACEWNTEKNGKLTPDNVTCKSGKKVWWICRTCGTEWEAVISHRTNGTGCPNCAGEKISKSVSKLIEGENDLMTQCPEIAEEWNYEKNKGLIPKNVYYKSSLTVWWKCKYCGNEFTAPIVQRTKLKTLCKNCTYAIRGSSLADSNPELLKEWDYSKNKDLNPQFITPGSAKRVWWKCSVCSNEWQTRINHRVNGSGCPKCSIKKSAKSEEKSTENGQK